MTPWNSANFRKSAAGVDLFAKPDWTEQCLEEQLKAILEKYDYQLPRLEDQVINRYIKEVVQIAGAAWICMTS